MVNIKLMLFLVVCLEILKKCKSLIHNVVTSYGGKTVFNMILEYEYAWKLFNREIGSTKYSSYLFILKFNSIKICVSS